MTDPRPLLRTTALAGSVAALSGALFHIGTGLHPVWWVALLAPIPVAWAAPRLGGWNAFGTATLAWGLGVLNEWSYFRSLHLPTVVVVVLATALPALVFGLAVALFRALVLAGAAVRAAAALPAVWVAFEFVQARTGSQGTFGSLAYTQVENLPLLQLAAVVGIWGVSFAVLFFPAASAVVLTGSIPWRRRLRLLGVAAVFAFAILGFGLHRLHEDAPSAQVAVGVTASDLGENVWTERPARQGRLLRAYLAQAEELTTHGARLVVLPEKLAEVDGAGLTALDRSYQALADRAGATLVVGMVRAEQGATFNEARVYRRGTAPASYRKERLLPGWESRFTPGRERLVVPGEPGRVGVAICKDMDFPETGRAYRGDAVDLVVVPAWDFDLDGWLHARMAVVRGVEGGFAVIRSAKQGLLTVSDDRGRILAERPSTEGPFPTLLAAVPVHHERTPYGKLGDAFGWATLVVLTGLLGSLLRRRPRTS